MIHRIPAPEACVLRPMLEHWAHALDDLAGHMEDDQFALASLTADHAEGVEAFLQRRKPSFKGR